MYVLLLFAHIAIQNTRTKTRKNAAQSRSPLNVGEHTPTSNVEYIHLSTTQENESKRNRAVKRAGDERKQREQKEQEIIKLKKHCRERQDEETRLRRDLEEHRRYQDFLAQVCDEFGTSQQPNTTHNEVFLRGVLERVRPAGADGGGGTNISVRRP